MKIIIAQCNRCTGTSGGMSFIVYHHKNGDCTKKWNICWRCEDEFWSWVTAKDNKDVIGVVDTDHRNKCIDGCKR